MKFRLLSLCVAIGLGCGGEGTPAGGAGAGGASLPGEDRFGGAPELRVTVSPGTRALVRLDPLAVVAGDGRATLDWDLAFEGWEVGSNSGVSGMGQGAAFGPVERTAFSTRIPPEVPFLQPDRAGGAFLDWYAYQGAPAHALWSRNHVYGVRDADRLWKVQILGYYGERAGAPVSALYRVRWAQLLPSPGEIQERDDLDGTAGGTAAPPDSPSECLDLGSGVTVTHGPDQARAASDWHLCFRRQSVSVNGGIGGPRGTVAVDLDEAQLKSETVATVMATTPEAARARFDAAGARLFEGLTFRGDGVVSGFGSGWVDRSGPSPAPAEGAWVVVAADGTRKFLVGFDRFESPTDRGPGTVVLRVATLP